MKETEFRILGSELGEPDTYVDVTIDGIDGEGTVYFAEVNGKRTWNLPNSDIRRLTKKNLMVGQSLVGSHKLWDHAKQAGTDQKKTAKTDFGKQHLEDAQKSLFLAAYYETR